MIQPSTWSKKINSESILRTSLEFPLKAPSALEKHSLPFQPSSLHLGERWVLFCVGWKFSQVINITFPLYVLPRRDCKHSMPTGDSEFHTSRGKVFLSILYSSHWCTSLDLSRIVTHFDGNWICYAWGNWGRPKVMNGSQLKLRDLSRLVEDRGGPLANVEHGSKPFEPREKS